MKKLTRTELIKELYRYNGKIKDAYLDTLIRQAITYLDKDRCEIFKRAIEIAEGKTESI